MKKLKDLFWWPDPLDNLIIYGCTICVLVALAMPGCWGGNG